MDSVQRIRNMPSLVLVTKVEIPFIFSILQKKPFRTSAYAGINTQNRTIC